MKLRQQPIGIGQNLKHLRLNANYSQSELVLKLQLLGIDISCDIYKKIEQNRYNIKICELIALQYLFNVSYDEFFKDLFLDSLN